MTRRRLVGWSEAQERSLLALVQNMGRRSGAARIYAEATGRSILSVRIKLSRLRKRESVTDKAA